MFKINGKRVIVTGAGGAPIPFLIERLKARGYTVYAADMDKDAAGFHFADKGFVIPKGISREFMPALLNICKKEKVDAIVPLVDEELLKCVELQKHGVSVILPKAEFIRTCLDKYALMKSLVKLNIPVPETRLACEDVSGLSFPLIAKPRRGRGSRGFRVLNSRRDLDDYLGNTKLKREEIVLQDYIEGYEFTVSVMVWRDSGVQAVVPKEIILKRGITRLAVTRKNRHIDSVCRNIQERLSVDGPFNVQLMVESKSANPHIFEINPRFSSSVSLTIEAGVDEVGEILDQELLGKPAKKLDRWKEGVVLVRQSADYFMQEKEFILGRRNIKRYSRVKK